MAQDSYNFSAGPAMLPSEVKLQAIEELARNGRDGFSVIEISHRSDRFLGILEDAEHRGLGLELLITTENCFA